MSLFGSHIRQFDEYAGGFVRQEQAKSDEAFPEDLPYGKLYGDYVRLTNRAHGFAEPTMRELWSNFVNSKKALLKWTGCKMMRRSKRQRVPQPLPEERTRIGGGT